MLRALESVHAQNSSATGVLGRLTAALEGSDAGAFKSAMFSTAGNKKITDHPTQIPISVSANEGIVQLSDYAGPAGQSVTAFGEAVHNLTKQSSGSLFAETFASALDVGLNKSLELGTKLNAATTETEFGDDDLSQQLKQIAKLLKVGGDTERAVFAAEYGDWDTHGDEAGTEVANRLSAVDAAVGSFAAEMKAQGIWDDVVVVAVSEFGRTLSTNGQGTDHGWGGNYFMTGGSVDGGQMLGQFPSRLAVGPSDVMLENGRAVPTKPWEAVWSGVAEWMGVPASDLPFVIPNAGNFPATDLFTKADLFR